MSRGTRDIFPKQGGQELSKPRNIPAQRPGPVGGKRDTNRRQRTQALCESALELFLERGIQSVTIDQIVSRAGTAKGSFYRYFRNKEELVEALLAPMSARFSEAFERCDQALEQLEDSAALHQVYEELGGRLIGLIIDCPELLLLHLQESRSPATGACAPIAALAESITEKALMLTETAHRHGLLRPVNPHVSALTVIGAAERLLFDYLRGRDLGNPMTILQDLVSMILEGLQRK